MKEDGLLHSREHRGCYYVSPNAEVWVPWQDVRGSSNVSIRDCAPSQEIIGTSSTHMEQEVHAVRM